MLSQNKFINNNKKTYIRSVEDSDIIYKSLEIVLKSEILLLNKLQLFQKIFLNPKTHSLEDMFLHQIEIPKIRKIIGYKTNVSLVSSLFKCYIDKMKETIEILNTILSKENENVKIAIQNFCKHIEKSICPLLEGIYYCWEWILQAIDLWDSSEKSYQARLPDLIEQLECNNDNTNMSISGIMDYLLVDFFEDISNIFCKFEPISKQGFLKRYLKSDNCLKNMFSLPIIRIINYIHIFKLYESLTCTEHHDYLSVCSCHKALSYIIHPIFKGINLYNRLLSLSNEYPNDIKQLVIRKYRIVLLDINVTFLPKKKEKHIIICNDIIIEIKHCSDEFKYKINPIPNDLCCELVDGVCQVRSPFGWKYWDWISDDNETIKIALLRAKRYICLRNTHLFNRHNISLESLLPLELVKIAEELHTAQLRDSQSGTITIAQMMQKILEKADIQLEENIEKYDKINIKKEPIECSWILEGNGSSISLDNLVTLLESEYGYNSFLKYAKRCFCSEVVLFYKDIIKYMKNFGTQNIESITQDIATNYLDKESPLEVNIAIEVKLDAISLIENKQYTYHLFDECKDRVIILMLEDIFPSYLESNEFKEYTLFLEDKEVSDKLPKKKKNRLAKMGFKRK